MIEMKAIYERFDICEYCRKLGMHDVELFINGGGRMYLEIYDTYPDIMECVIGNIGEKGWVVRNGLEKPSLIIEVKCNLRKIALDISKEMCYS